MMKPIKIYPAIIIILGLALFGKINAQDNSSLLDFTYRFEFKKIVQGDTLPILYCVMNISDLTNFDKVCLSYNDKTISYYTWNLFNAQSEEYYLDRDSIYFKIRENLTVPFIVVEGVDLEGQKYDIKERNAKSLVINPKEVKEKWEKSIDRVDSMDYIRKYNGVYKGRDGKPRFRDRSGHVYIIEKDHIRAE